ncbi:MAG TPA: hypothetical protein VKZ44_06305, partial [Taishania sp.]|nr:hypothetical protein [Taishania sp.]
SIGGKRVDIDRKDLLRIAEQFTIKNPSRIIDEVVASIPMFAERASELAIEKRVIQTIEHDFNRL